MEVILLEPIRNLGRIGDIVNVKNGYARNFLIPNGMVLFASQENKAVFEEKKDELIKANGEKEQVASHVGETIEGKIITIIRQSGDDGRLYGSVNSKDITDGLNEKFKIELKKSQVALSEPIKYIGVHTETINVYGGVSVNVNINVARNQDEAKIAKEKFLNPEPEKKDAVDFDYVAPKSEDSE